MDNQQNQSTEHKLPSTAGRQEQTSSSHDARRTAVSTGGLNTPPATQVSRIPRPTTTQTIPSTVTVTPSSSPPALPPITHHSYFSGLADPESNSGLAVVAPSAPLLHYHDHGDHNNCIGSMMTSASAYSQPLGHQTTSYHHSHSTNLGTSDPHYPSGGGSTQRYADHEMGDPDPLGSDSAPFSSGPQPEHMDVETEDWRRAVEARYRKEMAEMKEHSRRKRVREDEDNNSKDEMGTSPKASRSNMGQKLTQQVANLEKLLMEERRANAERSAEIKALMELVRSQQSLVPSNSTSNKDASTKKSSGKQNQASGSGSKNKNTATTKGTSKTSKAAASAQSQQTKQKARQQTQITQRSRTTAPGSGGNLASTSRGQGSQSAGNTNDGGDAGGAETTPPKPSEQGNNTGQTDQGKEGDNNDKDSDNDAENPDDSNKKKTRRVYALSKTDVSTEAQSIKLAFMFHIRVLWNQISRTSIPSDPPKEVLKQFDQRFTSEDDLYKQRHAEPIIHPNNVSIQRWDEIPPDPHNKNIMRLRQIPDTALQMMRTTAARYGLKAWAPDLRQAPYGLYNSACRMSAIDSFRQAVIAQVYAMFAPTTRFISDMDLLIKIYDHTVHYFHYRRYVRELANPGANAEQDEDNTVMQNRLRLAKARKTFAIKSGYPKRYLPLFTAKATSDDERADDNATQGSRPVFWIKRRPERSTWAERFICKFEEQRHEFHEHAPGKKRMDRIRIIPPPSKRLVSPFKRLPKDMPLDYFDPVYFNERTPRLRSLIADQETMVFLPNIEETFQRPELEEMKNQDFLLLPDIIARRNLYQTVDPSKFERTPDTDDEDLEDEEETDAENGDTADGNKGQEDAGVTLAPADAQLEDGRRERLAAS
ncbi:hypothetical protein CVT24_007927 [Panaeolus cyanescens]|uniref:Uncharacterized protein n=1 Tax=Panaeolus cyanescens TaxID=181874 RepID=A0A409WD17_9AGAR|nr:hypothetical protein CVT24_007927 [Panaeolus cyanescens]